MSKINILVIPSDNMGGVGFYRSTQPHKHLEKLYPSEFSVTFDMHPDFSNLQSFDKYDIIQVHKGLFPFMGLFRKALEYWKEKGILTIMDIDDHWNLGPHHPQYYAIKHEKLDVLVKENLKLFDIVTTTTPIFAKEISKYNKNVFVLPNAIDPNDDRFKVNKEPSNGRLRIGMIMGSTHEYDLALLGNISNRLPKDVLDKIQFVLCGFDTRGSMKVIDRATGKISERPIKPEETVWYRYEKQLTDNYKIVDERYKTFLNMFLKDATYPNERNEVYRRCWTKDINNYYSHYATCDVLLAPLEVNDFNLVKSQLKAIESCFSNTALIASDFGPYTIDLKSYIKSGGEIDHEGNALLVDEAKNHKQWAKYIEKLVNNPEMVKELQKNLHDSLSGKYNLDTVTEYRAEVYRESLENVREKKKNEENK